MAQEFLAKYDRLHILVHSAGIHYYKRKLTTDRVEYNFAANYLCRFLLTELLHDCLEASVPARVVAIGSPYKFDPERFLSLKGLYDDRTTLPLWALLQSGMAVGVGSVELARRWKDEDIYVNNVNPGLVQTDILRNDPLLMRLLDRYLIQPLFGMTTREGARTPLWVATAQELEGISGQFYRVMKPYKVPKGTYSHEIAKRLWQFSLELVGSAIL